MKGTTTMNTIRSITLSVAAISALALAAREVPGEHRSSDAPSGGSGRAAACAPATASNELNFNNVRALIETGGNMWQIRGANGGAAYQVPRVEDGTYRDGPNALFAGALWMGGLSPDNILKLAAVRFRQEGNDFWPGPLTTTGDASVDGTVCTAYDRTWKTWRDDAAKQQAYWTCLGDPDCDIEESFPDYVVPGYFYDWPAHGDVSQGQDYFLAPFFDRNGDDFYDPDDGDYPGYDLQKVIDCKAKRREDAIPLFGDQNIWWVFNDKGNTHTESGGQPIGMEIRAQAFAFATNDEVNNMTFYNYVLINQGTQTLTQTYFGQWVDVDLGGPNDDYVGCDVGRGLGYGYNGDEVDEDYQGNPGYGGPNPPPPAVGVDFFEGPYQDYDSLDNPLTTDCDLARAQHGIPYKGIGIGYGDGEIDNERFGMRAFVYHNNAAGPQGDPSNATQYYGYLRAIWGDGTPMTYGGEGYSLTSGGTRALYMFPGSTDSLGWGTDCAPQSALWNEVTAGNTAADRRFIQSAGPFTLDPGAYNNITVGVVWARANSGGVAASVALMQLADDKAQALFDNCFRILDGPDAPTLTIQELDHELILYLTNPLGSNNYKEGYHELDPTIPETSPDREYDFQGYKVFQVANSNVSSDQLNNPDLARLIAQVDIEDGVKTLINWDRDAETGLVIPAQMVVGADTGLVHSFQVTEDLYATGSSVLTNFKTYYFMAIAYGYNEYAPYDVSTGTGQAHPYLAGRKSPTGAIRVFAGIPHKPTVENGGTVINAQYGQGFKLTRIEGQGNGGRVIALDGATLEAIVASPDGRLDNLTYETGLGPVQVKVVDPLNVPAGDFELWLTDTTSIPTPTVSSSYNRLDDASWMLVHLTDQPTTADTVRSTGTIHLLNEQLILDWGLSVTMTQTGYSGVGNKYTDFLDDSPKVLPADWYAGIPDEEGEQTLNWIRSGTAIDAETLVYPDYSGVDPEQKYEGVLGGTWAPWMLVGRRDFQPSGWQFKDSQLNSQIKDIPSIEVVFTPDKNKWSRCVVVETCDTTALTTPSNVKKLHMRPVASVDKNGIPSGTPGCNEAEATLISSTGMGWFPGYAVALETGERLNIFFGENSFVGGVTGRDMLWNPSALLSNNVGQPVFGGGHWIYVTRNVRRTSQSALAANRMPQYDQCAFILDKMQQNTTASVEAVFDGVAWVGSALLAEGSQWKSPQDGLIPSEVHLRINVNQPYNIYKAPFDAYEPPITNTARNRGLPLYGFTTGESAVAVNVTPVGQEELDLIGVVPNPYYAYSGYETGRLDNRVKFINLPKECTISIYTVSGTLVRQFKKDNELTYLDWDLKNNYNVPIAGGTYLCHIDAPGLGERVIKWFGVMRPIDLRNF